MKARPQALRMSQADHQDQPQRQLSPNELYPNQKVYVGFNFAAQATTTLPARVLAVFKNRIRVRIPSPPGHNHLTVVRTVSPKQVTRRLIHHDILDADD